MPGEGASPFCRIVPRLRLASHACNGRYQRARPFGRFEMAVMPAQFITARLLGFTSSPMIFTSGIRRHYFSDAITENNYTGHQFSSGRVMGDGTLFSTFDDI